MLPRLSAVTLILAALLLPQLTPAGAKAQASSTSQVPPPSNATSTVTNHVPAFDRFAMATIDLPDAERMALFIEQVGPLLPGFYHPRGRYRRAAWEQHVLATLRAYPAQRTRLLAVSAEFDRALADGEQRFRAAFPDYRAEIPVHLVHALGEMDGGTRTLGGRVHLIFGADMIAALHDLDTIGPLVDHELFHTYHLPRFGGAGGELWRSLWVEGLAVHAAATLNPGVSDRALLLSVPVPIRPAVDARWSEAIASVQAMIAAPQRGDHGRLFSYRQPTPDMPFPPRYGYYVGYRIAARLGRTRSLAELARLTPREVKPLIDTALAEMATEASTPPR